MKYINKSIASIDNKITIFNGTLIPLTMAASIFLFGCSSSPISTTDRSYYSKTHRSTIDIAENLIGSPYRYGGAKPDGFDCSGFVFYVYNKVGISIPRTTKNQFHQSKQLAFDKAQPGDLIFFRTNSHKVSHVGLYTGSKQFIHASTSQKQVIKTSLDNPYWHKRLISTRRIY
jgi:cell wall-associated NlpC family hydrolase